MLTIVFSLAFLVQPPFGNNQCAVVDGKVSVDTSFALGPAGWSAAKGFYNSALNAIVKNGAVCEIEGKL